MNILAIIFLMSGAFIFLLAWALAFYSAQAWDLFPFTDPDNYKAKFALHWAKVSIGVGIWALIIGSILLAVS